MQPTFKLLLSLSVICIYSSSFCMGDEQFLKNYIAPEGPSLFPVESTLWAHGISHIPDASVALEPKQKSEPSHHLKLIIKEAEELNTVLTLDKEFYDAHICDRERSEEFRRQLMAESVAHTYLIPSVRALLEHIKELAQQEKTDPEMKNLRSAIAIMPSLELKYLKATYEWEKQEPIISDSVPVHKDARSKPLNRQRLLIQCNTTVYQASMGSLLSAYKEHRKEAQEKALKEVAQLQEELAQLQVKGTSRQNAH